MTKRIIRNLVRVFALGGIAALFSALAGATGWAAGWLFCCIAAARGYFAVLLFALALLATAATLYTLMLCGSWIASMSSGKYLK